MIYGHKVRSVELDKLKAEKAKKEAQVKILQSRIRKIMLDAIMPKKNKKYKDKYFIVEDFSDPLNPYSKYFYVHKLIDDEFAVVDSFESTVTNVNTFKIKEKTYYTHLSKRIDEKDYMEALSEFKKKFNFLE